MSFRHLMLGAVSPALLALCSCYTNVNQAWFNKQYTGYRLDYYTDEPVGLRGLPPVLYRCGEDWYIAAIRCEVKDRDYHLHFVREGFHRRHGFALTPLPGRPVAYHKITPEMARWMLRSDHESPEWFKHDSVIRELSKAGGEWLEQLPPGAVPVKAEFLKYCRARANYVEELPAEPTPWYTYPLAGLTFLCVDVPCSAVATAVPVVSLIGLLYIDSKQDDSADAVASRTTASFKEENKAREEYVLPLSKETYDYDVSTFPASFKPEKVREADDARPRLKDPFDDDYYNLIDRPRHGKHHHSGGNHSHPSEPPHHHGKPHHAGGSHFHPDDKPHHSGGHHSHAGDKPHHDHGDKPHHHDKHHDSDSDKENSHHNHRRP